MKLKTKKHLTLWIPTGEFERSNLRTIWKVLSSPVLLISVAVVDIAVMFYFGLTDLWWVWGLAPVTIGLAIMVILLRYWAKEKLIISNRQANKFNRFGYAAQWLPNRYLNRIAVVAERTQNDDTASILLFRHFGEALVSLGLYEKTNRRKTRPLTGYEFIEIEFIEFYIDIILTSGIGYILLEPSVNLIQKTSLVDERIISRVLRESGINNWKVERISFDDDVVLFALNDETFGRAFDFTKTE